MANIVENSIIKLYNNYLDVVDGSNDALLEAWLERIKVCGGNDATKRFLAASKSRGSLQIKIERSTDWETAQKHIKSFMKYNDRDRACIGLREIKIESGESLRDYVDRFEMLMRVAYEQNPSEPWQRIPIGWAADGSGLSTEIIVKIVNNCKGVYKDFMVALAKQENDKNQSERDYIAKYGSRVKYPTQENFYNPFQRNTLQREGHEGIPWEL